MKKEDFPKADILPGTHFCLMSQVVVHQQLIVYYPASSCSTTTDTHITLPRLYYIDIPRVACPGIYLYLVSLLLLTTVTTEILPCQGCRHLHSYPPCHLFLPCVPDGCSLTDQVLPCQGWRVDISTYLASIHALCPCLSWHLSLPCVPVVAHYGNNWNITLPRL